MSAPYRIICGDSLASLRDLPAESVHCAVTSPPYWGLRDYGTATWEGGDPACDHTGVRRPGPDDKSATNGGTSRDKPSGTCRRCGARRIDQQIGLEETPDAYVARLVAVFAELRRVLRDDGTLWLNLGDSYNAYNGNPGPSSGFSAGSAADTERPHLATGHGLRTKGLKPKDLVGIPWRVAFALQADGWYLRSDIIWSKPNPTPESVTDRPTKAHEYLFLLAKSERYYFDADAIREPLLSGPSDLRKMEEDLDRYGGKTLTDDAPLHAANGATNIGQKRGVGHRSVEGALMGRNRRSVWEVATVPFPGAHFATFPPDLAKPCILAGCPVGGTVLDPFCGSGTAGVVALANGREFVGLELNPAYVKIAERRIRDEVGGLQTLLA